jgi:hypothetical protein
LTVPLCFARAVRQQRPVAGGRVSIAAGPDDIDLARLPVATGHLAILRGTGVITGGFADSGGFVAKCCGPRSFARRLITQRESGIPPISGLDGCLDEALAIVGRRLPVIGVLLALVRQALPLVGYPLAIVSKPLPLVGLPVSIIRPPLAIFQFRIHNPQLDIRRRDVFSAD